MQNLIFILQFKLNQSRSEALSTPLWEVSERLKQLNGYYTELFDGIQGALKGVKIPKKMSGA